MAGNKTDDHRVSRDETYVKSEEDDWRLTDRIDHEDGRGDPFEAAVRTTRMPMAVTDPRQPDNPLIFVNQAFQDLSGYDRSEILGRNCRFLQGPETDPAAVAKLRQAIADKTPIRLELLNYHKNGSTFWNELQVSPVFGADGQVDFFFASQVDITDRIEAARLVSDQEAVIEREVRRRTAEKDKVIEGHRLLMQEVDHRVKNNLAMIASLIHLEGRSVTDPAFLALLNRVQGRVETMSTIHQELYMTGDGDVFSLSAYTEKLAKQIVSGFGRGDIDLKLDVDPGLTIPADRGASYGLVLNEILTNALKHAFNDGGGELSVTVKQNDQSIIVTIADDGPGLDWNVPRSTSIGGKLVERLSAQMHAKTRMVKTDVGMTMTVTIDRAD